MNNKSIAIVGMGGIFPGARDLDTFWNNIIDRKDNARSPPLDRWSLAINDVYDQRPAPDKVYSNRACFVEEFELDLDGLDIDKALLDSLDPMFSLLLYAGKQAWQDCVTSNLNRKRTGIIIGNIALPTDMSSRLSEEILGELFESNIPGLAKKEQSKNINRLNRYVAGLPATILARALGIGGTCYTLDAACASSLYSLKYGIDELQSGRADAMLCGGLSRPDSLYTQMGFSTLGAVSASGRCSPFDNKADGLVVGEGSGIVVLKRLEDALQDNDDIYATIKGIGLSNDIQGNLMLPDSEGQIRAMRSAYKNAGWSPGDVDLIECHGTGTPAGDKIEFNSMQSLWANDKEPVQKCVIGSVKSNVGHLLTAAGSAGLIKVLLAMKNKKLPPMANFEGAARRIDIENSPFCVLNEAKVWSLRSNNVPRRAAVSAFGFGGINAHVLLEEYSPARSPVVPSSRIKQTSINNSNDAIAIIGLDTHFGPWDTREKFLARVLGNMHSDHPVKAENRWGLMQMSEFKGYTINHVDIPMGRFRIPPKELQDMLPQQLLMLKVAANALDDAGLNNIENEHRTDAGVFIGIGLDLNTTNFHLRWSLLNKAKQWSEQLGLDLNDEELHEWIKELRDQVGPPLSANRTMGALGGIVASRIARSFNIGGPGFTLSSEESSGMHAMELAVRALQRNELNIAITGAVDLSGDVRAAEGQHHLKPYSNIDTNLPFDNTSKGTLIGEGAVALVLKRYADAKRDGDRIYSLITGLASTCGGHTNDIVPTIDTYKDSAMRACEDAGITTDTISCLETHGSGNTIEDELEAIAIKQLLDDGQQEHNCLTRISSVKADIGHTGAASGLVSIARASLGLYHHILPGMRGHSEKQSLFCGYDKVAISNAPQYWLRNRTDGPRRTMVASISTGGNSCHAILEQTPQQEQNSNNTYSELLSGTCKDILFSINGDTEQELSDSLTRLDESLNNSSDIEIQLIARDWYNSNKHTANTELALSILANDLVELKINIQKSKEVLKNNKDNYDERIFFTREPLAKKNKLAFVFPGSGNHFQGMGQDIACHWPKILNHLESENNNFESQFASSRFWNDNNSSLTHEDVIFGQVWLGTFVSDVVSSFGIKPDAVIGYSLGETAGLFATRSWTDRDLMLERMKQSSLFKTDLAGPCESAKNCWGLSNHINVDWQVGVINCPAEKLINEIEHLPWVYHLISNTPDECVIGGNRIAIESLVKELNVSFLAVDIITTVHCELAKPVAKAYKELHLFETTPPENTIFYSCHTGSAYEVTKENAANSIVNMALQPFDFTRVINSAYDDGARIFIEMGPGASCTRMIDQILIDKPHASRAICVKGRDGVNGVLQTLALLNTHRLDMDLSSLYLDVNNPDSEIINNNVVSVKTGHDPVAITLPRNRRSDKKSEQFQPEPKVIESADIIPHPSVPLAAFSDKDVIEQMLKTESAKALTHETYLRVANGISQSLSQALSLQMSLLESGVENHQETTSPHLEHSVSRATNQLLFDRNKCMEFATGSIEKVLGSMYADIDNYPTRVRLPDEPLMLVDRILEIHGEPCSITSGRVITEHDIHADAWYLDGGCIPTCIAVESGQADLFLSGFLGIDLITKGLAVYRLLDAEITFHDLLPMPGNTIKYDISIDHFFKQGDTHLFRFEFDGTVDGEPLLTMRNGCAGFFTQAELDAGKGIVLTEFEKQPKQGILTQDWIELVPMIRENYNEEQINALRNGDMENCFGLHFKNLPLTKPIKLPSGRMTLVHRILDLNPGAGRFGLGMITGEADINPDDWFLTCHFIDDQVMPGTLMYECCLHTLRIYLTRMGWVAEENEVVYQPIPGITSKLKCRGQVIAETSKVQYEITIKELGYNKDGTPYVIADALMYADNRPIVQMTNMSTQLNGLSRNRLTKIWQNKSSETLTNQVNSSKNVLFDVNSILAFATGKPSLAFGDRYLPFDDERVIARLPGPPYQFLDRIVSIKNCEPWQLKSGGIIEAEYDVPKDAWYFSDNHQTTMPFSVLLEVALQPCGWLAAYLGSALTSDTDLSFRNLGGSAVQYIPVTTDTGTLTTRVIITKVSTSGGMIIQNYDYEVFSEQGIIYKGDTYFGFFSKQALANQVGIKDAALYQPTTGEISRSIQYAYPDVAPYPVNKMRMIDTISFFDTKGGPSGLGFIRGTAKVDPEDWFFKAHFYQDPVWPGSLGLESFIQLLKVVAIEKWGLDEVQFESMALNEPHNWFYRGQILPVDSIVTVEASIKHVDNKEKLIKADGFLSVDGRTIYQMTDFTLRIQKL
jgi:PfaB family protein